MPKKTTIGGLSPNEVKLLAYLREYIPRHGHGPTYPEIGEAIGHKSKGSIARVLGHLETGGLIKRIPGKMQAIQITAAGLSEPLPNAPSA